MTRHVARLMLSVVAFALAAATLLTPTSVRAGGWALGTLDTVPQPRSNETVTIGFTILQHGVTPVNPDQGDIGIRVSGPDGDVETFPARQEGPVGHFVADVTFRDEGVHEWSLLLGWFAPQVLSPVDVAAAGDRDPGTAAPWWPITSLVASGALVVAGSWPVRRRRVVVIPA